MGKFYKKFWEISDFKLGLITFSILLTYFGGIFALYLKLIYRSI